MPKLVEGTHRFLGTTSVWRGSSTVRFSFVDGDVCGLQCGSEQADLVAVGRGVQVAPKHKATSIRMDVHPSEGEGNVLSTADRGMGIEVRVVEIDPATADIDANPLAELLRAWGTQGVVFQHGIARQDRQTLVPSMGCYHRYDKAR